MTPTVSVLMPVYNGERYLAEAVDSVLAQTFTDFEFVIVDDGSKDGSLAVLQWYAARDPRVRIISRPNTGIVGALNDGLAAARGELVARMDADDVCHPERFRTQVEYLRAHPACVVVGSRADLIDPDGERIGRWDMALDHDEIDRANLAGKLTIVHPSLVFRRAAVVGAGAYRQETAGSEDLDLMLRLAETGRLANVPDVLLRYRRHHESLTHSAPGQVSEAAYRALRDAWARRGLGDPPLRPAARAPVPPPRTTTRCGRGWRSRSVTSPRPASTPGGRCGWPRFQRPPGASPTARCGATDRSCRGHSRMRITFVCPPPDLSGGQRVVATYADRLQRRGHSVTIVTPRRARPGLRAVARSLLRTGRWPLRPPTDSHFARCAAEHRLLDRNRPVTDADVPDADVVIATWWETAEWVMNLAPKKGAKVYFIQHHEVFEYLPVERVEASWRLPLRKIVVARWLADLARDRYGDPAAELVPNAVDLDLFHAPSRGRNKVPVVGTMYSTVHFKGCDTGLEAVRLAAARLHGLKLLAFGAAPVDPSMPLPPGAEFHLRPQQDRIRELYARCDVWLFASRSEGFGLPILEAMACRTPVIGTPAGAAPELIARGGGCLVEYEDPADMAAAIVRVCSQSDSEWQSMSDAAYATATQYTWADATDLFERALRAAVGQAPPRPAGAGEEHPT
ncbi:glycosyltransferase [Frigoriglobus tundricola]|uniref:GT2/GT4 families glycosyltransferase n=1 Tax=Frigoriglobus tundricola TaxID=2774151 RepID=A0A6M5YFF1_9BACT|nr:glycosyltransferase [Frigoriglobus tundricola]QJW92708.1 GT2/GT4 families glycosyltransferase [Frigoriglobus tundricola]